MNKLTKVVNTAKKLINLPDSNKYHYSKNKLCKCGALISNHATLCRKCYEKHMMGSGHYLYGKNEIKSQQKFGRLTALSVLKSNLRPSLKRWKCRCECGKICIVSSNNLKRKNTKSCGCLSREVNRGKGKKARNYIHGLCVGGKSSKKYRRLQSLKHTYHISIDEYDKIKKKQNGKCAICGEPETRRGLSLDHNHKTGIVRGLLCSNCNVLLGYARENVDILKKSIIYLKGVKK